MDNQDVPESPDGRSGDARPVGADGLTEQSSEAGEGTVGARRTKVIVAVAAVVIVLLGAIAWWAGRPGTDSKTAEQASAPAAGAYVDSQGNQEHDLAPAPGEAGAAADMGLTIGDATAPVDPVQLTDQGALIPPQDVQRLGWYSASTVPGAQAAAGSTVITGHVNYAGQGEGFAHRFVDLKAGQTVTVNVDGKNVEYKVTQEPYLLPKGAPFPEVVDDTTGPNRLVLITCGGDFVGGQLGYAENVIVVAEPVA